MVSSDHLETIPDCKILLKVSNSRIYSIKQILTACTLGKQVWCSWLRLNIEFHNK